MTTNDQLDLKDEQLRRTHSRAIGWAGLSSLLILLLPSVFLLATGVSVPWWFALGYGFIAGTAYIHMTRAIYKHYRSQIEEDDECDEIKGE